MCVAQGQRPDSYQPDLGAGSFDFPFKGRSQERFVEGADNQQRFGFVIRAVIERLAVHHGSTQQGQYAAPADDYSPEHMPVKFVHREFTQLLINKRFGADDKRISLGELSKTVHSRFDNDKCAGKFCLIVDSQHPFQFFMGGLQSGRADSQ